MTGAKGSHHESFISGKTSVCVCVCICKRKKRESGKERTLTYVFITPLCDCKNTRQYKPAGGIFPNCRHLPALMMRLGHHLCFLILWLDLRGSLQQQGRLQFSIKCC